MNILVLLKQVPDTEANITPQENDINPNGIKWIMSPYDEIALEEAIRIKEKTDATVTILSVGDETSTIAIRTAYAMGADNAILIKNDNYNMLDSYLIAKALSSQIKELKPDLILAGRQATDSDNGQVPIILASDLDIPCLTFANKIEISDKKVIAVCEIDGGEIQYESDLPVIITANDRLNEPRYPSLKGIMFAKKKNIEIKEITSLGIDTSPTVEVISLSHPPARPSGAIIEGEDSNAKAVSLVNSLQDAGLL